MLEDRGKSHRITFHLLKMMSALFLMLVIQVIEVEFSFGDPGLIWVKGVGQEQLESGTIGEFRRQSGAAISFETPFNFASLTKPFTAFLIWQIMRQNQLPLNTPVQDLLPELPSAYTAVRVHHLLHHTSGIADYTFLCDGSSRAPRRAKEFLRRLKKLNFQPGKRYEYSNSNYLILSWLAERLSKKPFAEAMREWVLLPAGMSTAYLRNEVKFNEDSRVAWGYSATLSGRFKLKTSDSCDVLAGDGGLVATASDLVSWARYLDSSLDNGSQISELFKSGTRGLRGSEHYEYGLGWQLTFDQQGPRYQHAGGWLGYRSIFRFRPDSRRWLFVLQNRDDWDVHELADAIEAAPNQF